MDRNRCPRTRIARSPIGFVPGGCVVWDDDTDPYNRVREWWNSDGDAGTRRRGNTSSKSLGESRTAILRRHGGSPAHRGQGRVPRRRENPAGAAASVEGEMRVIESVRAAVSNPPRQWRERNSLVLERGPTSLRLASMNRLAPS